MAVTMNLDDFGYRELDEAIDILTAIKEHGLPRDFRGDDIRLAFNQDSGDVFLTNEDFEACALTDDGYLEIWHYTPYSGFEGFLDDLVEEYKENPDDWDEEDVQYLRDWGADV